MLLRKNVIFLVVVGLLLSTSAEAKRPPEPDHQKGTIGISLKIKGGFPKRAIGIYFVKLEGEGNILAAEAVFPADYSNGNRFYLLNAEPGRYSIVAVTAEVSSSSGPSISWNAFLPSDKISVLEMTLRAGSMVFVGHLSLRAPIKTVEPDSAQAYYARLLSTDDSFRTEVGGVIEASLIRDENTVRKLWATASRKDFKKSAEWVSLIQLSSEDSSVES